MSNMRTSTRVDSVPAVKIISQKIQFTIPIAPSGGVSIDLYPPEGKVGKNTQLMLWANAVPGSSSGTHYFSVLSDQGLQYIYGDSAYNSNLRFVYGYWLTQTGTISSFPADPVGAIIMSTSLKFSDDEPLVLNYVNLTNGTQTAQTYFVIDYEEVSK